MNILYNGTFLGDFIIIYNKLKSLLLAYLFNSLLFLNAFFLNVFTLCLGGFHFLNLLSFCILLLLALEYLTN